MPISERKLIANCLNAQKSTGPKTPLGKFRSSRNGLKHGLYSKFNLMRAIQLLPEKHQYKVLLSLIRSLKRDISGKTSRGHPISPP
ncbi:MAG: hypothetical protein NT002_13015 [candidate division Zixibacteria bacterium]|nr:hypothetical protein [candidate division Zixibacteria bacterium]